MDPQLLYEIFLGVDTLVMLFALVEGALTRLGYGIKLCCSLETACLESGCSTKTSNDPLIYTRGDRTSVGKAEAVGSSIGLEGLDDKGIAREDGACPCLEKMAGCHGIPYMASGKNATQGSLGNVRLRLLRC
ncbi:hypothetical protein Dimus_017160 [Dionaea muscipula]